MSLTDHSPLFAAVSEDGMNRFFAHVMRKRPSLFNYGTRAVALHWERALCSPPDVASEVLRHSNPVVSIEAPLPVLGTGGAWGLDFAAQLTDVRVDLHPQSAELPPELGSLRDQQFSITTRLCAGIGCPGQRTLDRYPPPDYPPFLDGRREADRREGRQPERLIQPVVLPAQELLCCCLEAVVVGHFEFGGSHQQPTVVAKLDGFELVDIQPDCLEANLECYLRILMHYVILPRLRIAVSAYTFGIMNDLVSITLKPSLTVPHNPAVEDDQLKLFIDLEVTT